MAQQKKKPAVDPHDCTSYVVSVQTDVGVELDCSACGRHVTQEEYDAANAPSADYTVDPDEDER